MVLFVSWEVISLSEEKKKERKSNTSLEVIEEGGRKLTIELEDSVV